MWRKLEQLLPGYSIFLLKNTEFQLIWTNSKPVVRAVSHCDISFKRLYKSILKVLQIIVCWPQSPSHTIKIKKKHSHVHKDNTRSLKCLFQRYLNE